MKRYIIERDLPDIGSKNLEELREGARKSNEALAELGPDIQWIESFVAGNKTFCVYMARDEDLINEHARLSGFPATKITEIRRVIDPTTGHR
jgi:hypothetical protein